MAAMLLEHAADEGIDDRQRRDNDHDAARPVGNDAVGEVVLERHGETIVHVDLDRDEQTLAYLENWDLTHCRLFSPGRAGARAVHHHPVLPPQGEREGVAPWVAFDTDVELQGPRMHDRLRDPRPDAADDAVRAHQP